MTTGLQLSLDDRARDPEWDRFVDSAAGGHHAQSSLWAEVKRVLGWEALRLTAREDSSIVGGIQVLTREVGLGLSVGFAPRGPLVGADEPQALDLLHDGLMRVGRQRHIGLIKAQPPTARHDLSDALEARGWTPSTLEAAPTGTIRVDLSCSEDELLGRMRSSTRTKIRKAARRGLTLRVGDESDLPAFARMIESTGRRQGFSPYPARYYETMWRVFAPSGKACLLVAECDDRVLSAILLVALGERAVYKMGGWSGESSRVRPNEAIHFAGMRWAKGAGLRWYDFDGIESRLARRLAGGESLGEEEYSGVTKFKLGFGGQAELTPGALDISPSRVLAPAVRLAAPRAERLLGLAHRSLGRAAV